MCSFFNKLFTVTGNNNTMHSKIELVTENIIPNPNHFFKLTQLPYLS